MKIWIVDKVGYVESYSLMEQPNQIAVEVKQEPLDIMNWRWTGSELIHDPENAPVIEAPVSELDKLKQENEELRQRQDMSDEAVLELADMVLAATDALKGGA